MLGRRPTKWRQRPNMTIVVDWDVKHQFKQTNQQTKIDDLFYPVAKTKALISFAVTAKLICAFVLAYAKCPFFLMRRLIISVTSPIHVHSLICLF